MLAKTVNVWVCNAVGNVFNIVYVFDKTNSFIVRVKLSDWTRHIFYSFWGWWGEVTGQSVSFDDAAVGLIASKYVRGGWRGFSRAAPPGSCLGLSRPGRALLPAQGALESWGGRGETSGSDLANFGDKRLENTDLDIWL